MNKAILSLCAGLIIIIVCCSNQLQAQSFQYNSLLQKYIKLGELDKIQVLMDFKKQNLSVKELVSRLKNSTELTTSERSVYLDMFKDNAARKATEFYNARTKLSSGRNQTSKPGSIAKSKSTSQFILTEFEDFLDTGGFGWHTLDKYGYDNNLNMIQWVNQNYDSTAGWVNSSLMLYSYDSFNRDTLEVNQAWDPDSLSWVNYGKWLTTYDASNNVINKLYYHWADPMWGLGWRYLFTYDASNNLLEVLESNWADPTWLNSYLTTYTYDANNNNLVSITSNWTGTEWQEFFKTENTYDANNNLISYTFSLFGNYSSKDIYTYDSSNNQISDTNYNWNSTSSIWVINFVLTTTYDAMNNKIHYLVQQSNGSTLVDYLQYDATFNSYNEITSWHSYTWNGDSWISNRKAEYSYDANHNITLLTDSSTANGGLTWKLFIHQTWTWSEVVTGIEENGNTVPINFSLAQNYPNPFNPSTVIQYVIPTASSVKLEVFNIMGENVATLVDGFKSEGYYDVKFNASELPSGMYLYRISAGTFVQTRKMILIK